MVAILAVEASRFHNEINGLERDLKVHSVSIRKGGGRLSCTALMMLEECSGFFTVFPGCTVV